MHKYLQVKSTYFFAITRLYASLSLQIVFGVCYRHFKLSTLGIAVTMSFCILCLYYCVCYVKCVLCMFLSGGMLYTIGLRMEISLELNPAILSTSCLFINMHCLLNKLNKLFKLNDVLTCPLELPQ